MQWLAWAEWGVEAVLAACLEVVGAASIMYAFPAATSSRAEPAHDAAPR